MVKLSELIKLRNETQPALRSNSDTQLYDYRFWKEVSSIADKQKKSSLEVLVGKNTTELVAGRVINGDRYALDLKISAAPMSFDLEKFIEALLVKYPDIPRHVIRELAVNSKSVGTSRKSFDVIDKTEE